MSCVAHRILQSQSTERVGYGDSITHMTNHVEHKIKLCGLLVRHECIVLWSKLKRGVLIICTKLAQSVT